MSVRSFGPTLSYVSDNNTIDSHYQLPDIITTFSTNPSIYETPASSIGAGPSAQENAEFIRNLPQHEVNQLLTPFRKGVLDLTTTLAVRDAITDEVKVIPGRQLIDVTKNEGMYPPSTHAYETISLPSDTTSYGPILPRANLLDKEETRNKRKKLLCALVIGASLLLAVVLTVTLVLALSGANGGNPRPNTNSTPSSTHPSTTPNRIPTFEIESTPVTNATMEPTHVQTTQQAGGGGAEPKSSSTTTTPQKSSSTSTSTPQKSSSTSPPTPYVPPKQTTSDAPTTAPSSSEFEYVKVGYVDRAFPRGDRLPFNDILSYIDIVLKEKKKSWSFNIVSLALAWQNGPVSWKNRLIVDANILFVGSLPRDLDEVKDAYGDRYTNKTVSRIPVPNSCCDVFDLAVNKTWIAQQNDAKYWLGGDKHTMCNMQIICQSYATLCHTSSDKSDYVC